VHNLTKPRIYMKTMKLIILIFTIVFSLFSCKEEKKETESEKEIATDLNIEAADYKIKKNLEEYLTQKSKSEVKFGFTEDERKQIFKEIVSAEDIANEYERKEQDKALDGILEKYGKLDDNSREKLKQEYDKISEKAKKIMTEEKAKVYKKQ